MRLTDLRESDKLVRKSTVNRGLFDGESGTHCDLKRWWFAFQKEAARVNIPLRVVWGFRTWEQQQELHEKGVGAPAGRSAHNFGLALDVIHMRRAWQHMPLEGWSLLGAMGQEVARKQGLEIQWGLYRKNGVHWDQAHWQVKDWRKMVATKCECTGGCLPADPVTFPYSEFESPLDHFTHVKDVIRDLKSKWGLGSRDEYGIYNPKT